MGIDIVRSFPTYREGRNPLEEILTEKRKMLETYQTPRTAKEFYEIIKQIFLEAKVPIKRGILFDREYSLAFQEQQGLVALYLEPNGRDTVAHIQKCSEIFVTVKPAFTIPGLRKDIFLGRNDPLDKMPTGVRINEETYALNYGYSAQGPMEGKLS